MLEVAVLPLRAVSPPGATYGRSSRRRARSATWRGTWPGICSN